MPHQNYQSCIDACTRCAEACEHCASACLAEPHVAEMVECIRLDQDCATFCWTAAALMSRGSSFAEDFCRVCAGVCDACGDECERHEEEHCQRCAEVCHECAEECRKMAVAQAA